MTDVVSVLAGEHARQGARLEELRRLAESVATSTPTDLVDGLDGIVEFLTTELLPHLTAEEAVLYRAAAEHLGSDAVELMLRDHAEIRHLVEQLRTHRDELGSQLLPVARHEVQRDLFVLHALVQLHVAKEDELVLPRLTASAGLERTELLVHDLRRAREIAVADGLVADGG